MKFEDIKIISENFYRDIEINGVETIKKLFSKGTELSEELRVNPLEEYIKKILISQMDVDKMLLSHKYMDTDFDSIAEYRKESEKIHRQINSDNDLKFDNNTINDLFENCLNITSEDDYQEWEEFTCSGMHNGIKYDTIYFEEEFKHKYENEKNIVKKFIKSFNYRRIMKGNSLEDVYIKKIREMLRKEISANPENTFVAYSNVHRLLEKGIAEYESIKEIEDISRMTLIPFIIQKNQEPINIEEICKSIRNEMKNEIGTTKIGNEYRKKAVTLGSETGIRKGPVIQTISFEEIPEAIGKLQKEYEEIYNSEKNTQEYIKGVTKIYADFMFIQPYEDGNKRTALCLLNSMLISKNIIPPAVSLTNNEEMIKAFYKVQEKDYTMLQDLVAEKCVQVNKAYNSSTKRTSRFNEKAFERE